MTQTQHTAGAFTAKQALKAFDKAIRFDEIARNSRARANWRTPGVETARREHERAENNLEKAEEQWAIVRAFIEQEVTKGVHPKPVKAGPECAKCDDTGSKDYAGFAIDACDCAKARGKA